MNPGLFTAAQELQVLEALTSFPKLVQGQVTHLSELKLLRNH